MPCCTLGRWTAEYGADGEDAFPGSGKPIANKDYGILKLKKENEGLRREVAILKESRTLLEASPSARFELVRTGEHGTSAKRVCETLGVSRGGYHAYLSRPRSSRRIAREALEPFVEDIFYANNCRYGPRRIVVEPRKVGIVANGKTVQRMMARKGLISCRGPRKHRRGGKASDKGANILNGEFSVQRRSSVRCGDNAVTEPLFKTLKRELPLDRKHDTRIEAGQEIFKFIELHCNTRRPHSPLGNLSPVEYERQYTHQLDSERP